MALLDSYVYHVDLEWTRGRSGRLDAEGLPRLEFSAPQELAGEPGQWTPEHLLVASVASCFLTTFMAIAELHKLRVPGYKMTAFARLEKMPAEGYRFTEITLAPEIQVAHEDVETALKVLEKAKKNCFISKSLRAAVQVEPRFVVPQAEPVAV